MTATPESPNIARRAYEIWEEEGRPHGHDRAHWDRAERELAPAAAATEVPAAEEAPLKKPARARKAAAAPAEEGEAPAKKPARARKAAAEPGAAAAATPRRRAAKPAEA